MVNLMSKLQDIEVDLILVDLEISKDFSNIQSLNVWIANTSALNDGTAHKRSIMNLRNNKLSLDMMGILSNALKKRYLCNTQVIFVAILVNKK